MSLFVRGRRAWFQALRVGPALLLLALLPSVLYLDHWLGYAERAFGVAGGSAEVVELEHGHAAHCHLSPGTCSEQAATFVVPAFPRAIELEHPQLPATLLEEGDAVLEQYVRSPLTEPPRL